MSIGILTVSISSFTPLDVKTVTKVSELYEEPIFLTFHWLTADEIQVGNLITLDIEIRNLPYNSNMMLENISIRFYEEQLNFWSFEGDSKRHFGVHKRVHFMIIFFPNFFHFFGIVNKKVVPLSSSLSAKIFPPMSST